MSYVKLTPIGEAEGAVQELYTDIQRLRGEGRVSNLFKGYAAFPALAKANWERMKTLLGGGTLSRKLKESIMMMTAQINGCEY